MQLKLKRLYAKVGEPPSQYTIISFSYLSPAAAALPAPQAILTEAKFEIGSQVRTVVDTTTPGVDSNQSAFVCGVVVARKAGTVSWTYTIRSNHYGRNKILVYFNHLVSATGWTAQAHKG